MSETLQQLEAVLEKLRQERDEAGRSEQGRQLALAYTHVEDALLRYEWAGRDE